MIFNDKNLKGIGTELAMFGGIFIISLILLITLPQTVSAQAVFDTSIQVFPENVRAGEEFSVGLVSSSVDLDRANITWYINEQIGLSGVGKVGFRSNAGPVGTKLNIRAEIEAPNGQIIRRTTIIQAQEIDFLWRSHSYTPPFYLGRSLAPSAGFVSITAMPNMTDTDGSSLDPRELIYTWSQNGIVLGEASGYGKQTIILENGQIQERLLKLQLSVSSRDGVIATQDTIEIPLSEPKILFYENHPLKGVSYERAVENVVLNENETVVRIEPYFFSFDDVLDERIEYKWKLNGRDLLRGGAERENEIIFRREGESGSARASVEIRNLNLPFRIFQKAEAFLNIDTQ